MAEIDVTSFTLALLSLIVSIALVAIQYQYQKLQTLEEKLREDRRKIYLNLLSPYFMLFSKPPDIENALKLMQSLEYRKNAFEFTLIGSDKAIRAFNDLKQFSYNQKSSDTSNEKRTRDMLNLFGGLLVQIRKDFGNDKTTLNALDMFKHLITDIDKIERQ